MLAMFNNKIYPKIREGLPMIVYMLVYLAAFGHLEKMTRLHYTNIHVALDDYIPFVEYFIVPYLLWFPYMIGNTVLLYCFNRNTYHRIANMLCLGMTVFIFVSLFWPNIQYLRPDVMPRDNMFTRQILRLYNTDTPTNLCPSIHVYNTLVSMVGVAYSKNTWFGKNVVYRWGSYTLGILIILSTIFIKQHSVFDVVCAFICVAISYVVVYKYNIVFTGKQASANMEVLEFTRLD